MIKVINKYEHFISSKDEIHVYNMSFFIWSDYNAKKRA